jgi:hypothetical protein
MLSPTVATLQHVPPSRCLTYPSCVIFNAEIARSTWDDAGWVAQPRKWQRGRGVCALGVPVLFVDALGEHCFVFQSSDDLVLFHCSHLTSCVCAFCFLLFFGTPPRRPIQEHLTCNDASFRKCKSGGDRRVYVRALPLCPTALTHVLVLAVNHIDTAPRAIRKYLFLTPISIDEFAMQSPGRTFSGPRR